MLGSRATGRSILGFLTLLFLSFGGPLRAELLLFYTFNDDSNPSLAIDESGSGNDGSIFVAQYTDAGLGRTGGGEDRAIDFLTAGSGTYISVDTATAGAFDTLTQNDAATVAMWLQGSESQPLNQWNFWFGPGRQIGSHIPWSDGTIYFDVAGCCAANQRLQRNEPDPTKYKGEWNHYAFVKDLDFTRIYQNGVLWAEGSGKAPLGTITEVFFGAGDSGHVSNYAGLFDDVGVWDHALSEEEIQEVMENGIGPPPPVKIRRSIPEGFLPGETITVSLDIEINNPPPNPPIIGLAVRERLPLYWVAKDPSAPGTLETEANGRSVVVWNIAGEIDSQSLTYDITVPDPYGNVRWPGSTAVAGGTSYGVQGNASVKGGRDPNVPEALVVTLSTGDPLACGGFAAPGIPFIQSDFMTDGDSNNEQVVAPVVGEGISPDFGGASPAVGPTGLNSLVWTRHVALNGVFNGYNICDSCMAYVATYVVNPTGQAIKVRVGSASDDSEQILVDGREVWINNVARGANTANPLDHSAPFDLTPGKHLVLQKVYEGCGGFDSSLRFEDEDRNPLVILRFTIDPAADEPQPGDPAYTAAGAFVLRAIPPSLDVGESGRITLKLRIKTPPVVGGTIEENVPAGFNIIQVGPGGQQTGQKITWSLPGELASADFSYQISIPEGSRDGTFVGTAVLGGVTSSIAGDQEFKRGVMNSAGFIKHWLVFGPIDTFGLWPGDVFFPNANPEGSSATPENDDLRVDYLANISFTEDTIRPFDGMRHQPDFGDLAKGNNFEALLRECAPETPTWEAFITATGTFNNDDYFGMAVESHATYAACYVTNTTQQNINATVAIDSDDAFIAFIDGQEVVAYDAAVVGGPCSATFCGRGYGAEDTYVETGTVNLAPGEHFLLTRVHDGFGGSGHRLRFQDVDGNPILPPALKVSLKPTAPAAAAYVRRILSTDAYRLPDTPRATIRIESDGNHQVNIREVLPAGWSAAEISHNGSEAGGVVTWSVAAQAGTTDLSYRLTSGDCPGGGSFCGNGVDGSTYTVDGTTHSLNGDRSFRRDTKGTDDLGAWLVTDIASSGGATQRAGDRDVDVTGKGSGIRSTRDEFRFISVIRSGDFEISARVECMDDPGTAGRGGLMVRDTLDTFSAHAFFALGLNAPGAASVGTLSGVTRTETKKTKISSQIAISDKDVPGLPIHLKLKRAGTKLTLHRSADGNTYAEVAARDIGTGLNQIQLKTDTLVGLAVTAGARVDFRDVRGVPDLPTFTPVRPEKPSLTKATGGPRQVVLTWTAPAGPTPSSYVVRRAEAIGGPYSTVTDSVTGTTYTDTGLLENKEYCYVVRSKLGTLESDDSNPMCARTTGGGPLFRRGNVNGDTLLDISDAIGILGYLFLGQADKVVCVDAADIKDKGSIDISDAISVLNFLFQGGTPPASPGPDTCGPDAIQEAPDLGCAQGC